METEHPVKLLLVDDRKENLLALEVILGSENYVLVKANSGREALKILLEEQDFALILMDVQMPIMGGFETAELIRQSEKLKQVPIIYLTANTDKPEDIFKGYKTGAVDYMVKPLSPEILKAKVSVFTDLYKKNLELTWYNNKLNQQSKYVRSIIESSLDPMLIINSEGTISDVNQALEKITGISRDKIKGTNFVDYVTKPKIAREVYQDVFAKGSIVDYLLTIKHADGKLTDVLFNGSVYKDDQGHVIGAVIVAREKLISKYSRSLIEASLDPLITINDEGKITDMNEALAEITGITREKITGTDFFDYFTEPEKAREIYQEAFAKGFVVNSPLTIRHKDGKLTDVLFNGSTYKDERGNVLGIVIVARDVTEQKQFENELIEAKRNAEHERQIAQEAVKAKQQFLSNMSHEIRTPMNAIIGFTKVVLNTDLTKKQKEYISAIKTSGDALIVLINDILDLAKVDAGKMSFEEAPFKLINSISSMLQLFETKIQENNVEMIREYDDSIPEVVLGDSVRLNQVILNLVSNAVKFTLEGKITVGVHLLKETAEKVTVEFSVTDTGIGIPEDKLDNIFDNFQQATTGTTRLYGGTGLGLAIAKQLIEAQGGKISVTSKVGKGSTFKFDLTFKKTTQIIETETESTGIQKLQIKDQKILVVEDVKLNQLLMKTLLEQYGCKIEIAANGKIAVDKVKDSSYDMIFMDLQMPEMNGFEATNYIRSNLSKTVPIIALTADVTTADLEKCKAAGMNDYISKPVDEKILYKKILKYINSSNSHKTTPIVDVEKSDPIKKPEYKYINFDYLKELTLGKPEGINLMIRAYLEETPKLIQAMKRGIESKDWAVVGAAAHSIIPSFSIVGISPEFEEIARKIEEYATERKPDQDREEIIKDLFSKIDNVCGLAIEELKHEF